MREGENLELDDASERAQKGCDGAKPGGVRACRVVVEHFADLRRPVALFPVLVGLRRICEPVKVKLSDPICVSRDERFRRPSLKEEMAGVAADTDVGQFSYGRLE